MTLSFTMLFYLILTLVFLSTAYSAAAKEIKARSDFEMKGMGGTMKVYRYYRHLRKNNERPSRKLKLLFLAYANLVLCMIIFAVDVFGGR